MARNKAGGYPPKGHQGIFKSYGFFYMDTDFYFFTLTRYDLSWNSTRSLAIGHNRELYTGVWHYYFDFHIYSCAVSHLSQVSFCKPGNKSDDQQIAG